MTKEQITEFEKFLKIREMYKIFYDSLSKCPLEMAFRSKETYLPRVPSILVLSYGFYQTRNINGIKESDWVILRNAWIKHAHEANALDDNLQGIDPNNIISAINSVFNGKQYRGVLRSADQVLEKIAAEARLIQEQREQQFLEVSAEEEKELQNIIEQKPMVDPEKKYSEEVVKARVAAAAVVYMNSKDGARDKKAMRSKCNEITVIVGTNNIPNLLEGLNDLVDLFEEYKRKVKEVERIETERIEEEKQKYIVKCQEFDEKKRNAIKTLLEIQEQRKRIEEIKKRTEVVEVEPVAVVDPGVEEIKADEEQKPESASADEIVALSIRKKETTSRVKVGEKQIYMVYKRTITTFGSYIDKMINDRHLMKFELVISGGQLCLRMNNTAMNDLTIRSHGHTEKLAIYSKQLIEYIRSYFKVKHEKILVDTEVTCTPDSVVCKILSVKNIETR